MPTIAMLSDIIDYLNTHQLLEVLSINTKRLDELATYMQSTPEQEWKSGTVKTLRQLREIRPEILTRLMLANDLDRWPNR